jgi:putative oxidoreductase
MTYSLLVVQLALIAAVAGRAGSVRRPGPPGWLWALLIGLVELVGGLLLAAGFLTRAAAAAVVAFMANAVLFHLPNGFFWSNGGYEYPLLWTVAALAFAIRGGGELSLDRRLGREI